MEPGDNKNMTFSSQSYLERKTGAHSVGRFQYLQTLVTEFQDTHKQGNYHVMLQGESGTQIICHDSTVVIDSDSVDLSYYSVVQ